MSTQDQYPLLELHPAEASYYSEIAVHKTWHEAADAAMKHLVSTHAPFTADDLRDLLGDCQPANPNSIGGLFMAWSRAGLITRCGGGNSRGPKRNGGYRHEWICASECSHKSTENNAKNEA